MRGAKEAIISNGDNSSIGGGGGSRKNDPYDGGKGIVRVAKKLLVDLWT